MLANGKKSNGNGDSGFSPVGDPEVKSIELTIQYGVYTNQQGGQTDACVISGFKRVLNIDGNLFEDRNRKSNTIMLFEADPTRL